MRYGEEELGEKEGQQGRASGGGSPEIMVPAAAVGAPPRAGAHLGRHSPHGRQPRAGRPLRLAASPGQAHGPHRPLHPHPRRPRSRWRPHRIRRRHSPRHLHPRPPPPTRGFMPSPHSSPDSFFFFFNGLPGANAGGIFLILDPEVGFGSMDVLFDLG